MWSCRSALYILHINSLLSEIRFANIFCRFLRIFVNPILWVAFFTLLIVSIHSQKFLMLMKSKSIFSFVGCVFWCHIYNLYFLNDFFFNSNTGTKILSSFQRNGWTYSILILVSKLWAENPYPQLPSGPRHGKAGILELERVSE